jgi:hypothetical protein
MNTRSSFEKPAYRRCQDLSPLARLALELLCIGTAPYVAVC